MAKESRFPYTTLGRESMLLLLTLVAASVDAISYLGLGHVFTAMMTGNTVLLGLALAQGEVAGSSAIHPRFNRLLYWSFCRRDDCGA